MGICLGLEIIANENIQLLFDYRLKTDGSNFIELTQSEFFITHRVNEDEHILKSIENFKVFCKSKIDKEQFISGFNLAIEFWEKFWMKASATTINRVCA